MSAVTNFLVSSLPDYVQTNRDVIVKNFALVGTATRQRIGLQTGVKGSAYMNFLNLAATLQDGSGCGFNPIDELTLSQRTMVTAAIKVDGQICPETLIGKYAEYLVRIAATENDLPFEQYIVDMLVGELNKKIEKLIWMGDHTASSNPDIKWIDGFIYKFDNDADVIDVAIGAGTTAYEGLVSVYAAMPEETLERGGVIFVAPAIYRSFLMDMVRLNYFHYSGPQDAAPEEFILPGTDVKVVKTPGLAGSLKVVGTFANNLVYGCDAENDEEKVDIWWSADTRMFRYEVKWNSGVQYFFPAQVVLGAFAATPAATAGANAALSTIATKSAGLDNLAGIKTDADKLAGAVNESNQIETHPNTAA